MKFTKMHGAGNDYVYVNCFDQRIADAPALARVVSDRHRGIGSDGLILICPSQRAAVRMEMYNADGSRSQMCGNGIRCVAKYAFEHGLSTANPMPVETDSGVLSLELSIEAGRVCAVRVNMGRPRLAPADLPADLPGDRFIEQPLMVSGRKQIITCVSMGNPHVVVFVDDLQAVDLPGTGAAIETHPAFPERTNVHFVRVLAPGEARMITWERGSGATQACGTGACAVGVAGVLTHRLGPRSTIHVPGGTLIIEYTPDTPVFMTGPAEEAFSGDWPD